MTNKEEKMKHVLSVVRCDLSLAIDMIPTPFSMTSDNDPIKRRLRHGIEMITNVLEDPENWQAIQERWNAPPVS